MRNHETAHRQSLEIGCKAWILYHSKRKHKVHLTQYYVALKHPVDFSKRVLKEGNFGLRELVTESSGRFPRPRHPWLGRS